RVLNIHPDKISDKGVASYDDRLTTVTRELGVPASVSNVREALCRGFEQSFKMTAIHLPFDASEREQIDLLENSKYNTPEWINQRIPAHDMLGEFVKKTPAGLIHAYVALSGDTIKSVLITGDFFSNDRIIKDIEAAIKWGRADKESIIRTIRVVMSDRVDSIHGLSADELGLAVSNAAANARLIETI
ncbi:MAG: lipoate protein ligase C-terminal domain-containing protein, partial [Armatimonadota bacterium]